MVDYKSENFDEMKAKGLLTRVEKGVRIDNTIWATRSSSIRPIREAREYVWGEDQEKLRQGVKIFWLDEVSRVHG